MLHAPTVRAAGRNRLGLGGGVTVRSVAWRLLAHASLWVLATGGTDLGPQFTRQVGQIPRARTLHYHVVLGRRAPREPYGS